MHAFLKQARQPPCSFFRRDGTPRCDTRSCLANGGDDVRWDMSNLSGSVEVSSCGAPVRPALELEKNFILHACFRRPPIQPLVVDYSLPTTAAPLRNWPAIVHVAIVAEGLSVSSRYASRPYRLCPPTARHDPPPRQTFRPLGSITTLDQTLFQFPSTTLVNCCTRFAYQRSHTLAEPVAAQQRRAGDRALRKRVHLPRGSHQPIPSLLQSVMGRKTARPQDDVGFRGIFLPWPTN
jgi:hypothetical protein